ncbi:hypothetical protein GLP30_03445 [Photobacterium phosphoreum]|uniref:Uncharacterized protein n=1 Tax=Photobacterium phosphoreum TaxID=659 RepID=A0AAW4ZTB9_PHOPO|nr:hypothetical protein [Photobacterium phosphoreum]MCD9489884.1 hypothetical protein [Photobacterium phosphoreum]MCD9501270.1 hypothetical protein [Photobacterium phosphoreum]MCD9518372.1 hypothetical protein [Photobacterium phosphoreum]MCF2189150.1 hypothetical protein [Photobacterium phosphoreum]MCF2301135.1 hypothetical protein [Photobacterium phosphoreum]
MTTLQSSSQIYSLIGTRSQILITVNDVADIVYYGSRLSNTDDNALQQMVIGLERPIPFGRLDSDILILPPLKP